MGAGATGGGAGDDAKACGWLNSCSSDGGAASCACGLAGAGDEAALGKGWPCLRSPSSAPASMVARQPPTTMEAVDKILRDPRLHDILSIVKGCRNGLVYGTKVRQSALLSEHHQRCVGLTPESAGPVPSRLDHDALVSARTAVSTFCCKSVRAAR